MVFNNLKEDCHVVYGVCEFGRDDGCFVNPRLMSWTPVDHCNV